MAKLLIATLFVILPVVFSATEKKGKSLSLPYGQPSGLAATGALGANYGQQTAVSETHDKKNFGLDFSSDKGSSNKYSNTGLQAAATGGLAQGQGQGYSPYSPYYGYPVSQNYYPQVYQQYPVQQYPVQQYPNYGVGSPAVGVGSQVQVPGVSAGSVAGVAPGGGWGQYPVRY